MCDIINHVLCCLLIKKFNSRAKRLTRYRFEFSDKFTYRVYYFFRHFASGSHVFEPWPCLPRSGAPAAVVSICGTYTCIRVFFGTQTRMQVLLHVRMQ